MREAKRELCNMRSPFATTASRAYRVGMLCTVAGALSCTASRELAEVPCQPQSAVVSLSDSVEFDSIGTVLEQNGNSQFVLDGKTGELFLMRSDSTRAERVLRRGAGPAEVASPGMLMRTSRDTILLFDVLRRRFLAIDSAGVGRGALSWIQNASGAFALVNQPTPFAADADGRVFAFAPADRFRRDSVAVLRCHVGGSTTCDTSGFVKRALLDEQPTARPGRAPQRAFVVGSLPRRGLLGVNTSGELLAISAVDLGVYVRDSHGGWQRRATLPNVRTPVSLEEWNQIVADDSLRTSRTLADGLAVAKSQGLEISAIPKELRTIERSQTRPKWYPPFSHATAHVSPDGAIWIERGHAQGAEYTVSAIRPDLTLQCVRLPANTRLVGAGTRTLFVAESAENGLEHVRKYSLPRERQESER